MAPTKTKQTILPLSTFCKNPGRKMCAKHKKLQDKVDGNITSTRKGPPAWKKKKEAEKRRKEKEMEEGARGWETWLRVKGVVGDGRIDPLTMFQVNGPAPPLESPRGDLYYDGELDTSSSSESGMVGDDGDVEESEDEM